MNPSRLTKIVYENYQNFLFPTILRINVLISPTLLLLRDPVTIAELLRFLPALLPSWLLLLFSSSLPALDKSRATDYNNSRKLSQIVIFEDLNRNYKFVILITLFLLLLLPWTSVELLGFLRVMLPWSSKLSFFSVQLLGFWRLLLPS